MLLRLYFTSRPRVVSRGRVMMSVCVTTEVGEPVALDCELQIGIVGSDGVTSLGPLADLRLSDAGEFPGDAWHTTIEGTVPARALGRSTGTTVQVHVAAVPVGVIADQTSVGELVAFDLAGGNRTYSSSGRWIRCMPCVSAPLALEEPGMELGADEVDHCFRHFHMNGRVVSIREELSCHEMSTGGRVWDASVALADFLGKCRGIGSADGAQSLMGKSFVELGCGCALPGITAAVFLQGRVVLTDRFKVLPVAEANAASNCLGSLAVAQLDWAVPEQRAQLRRDFGGQAFDVVLLSDTMYAPQIFVPLRDTLLELTTAGSRVFVSQKYRGECWDLDGSSGGMANMGGCSALGFVEPIRKLLGQWFDICVVQSEDDNPMNVVLLELWRVR